jgi:hypothetical protein
MEQIQDGRRNILIHSEATREDLPVTTLPELPSIADDDAFVPQGMDKPKIYPGDVVVGVKDDEIQFAELVYMSTDGGVLVLPLNTGSFELIADGAFGSRFYKADELHIYDGVVETTTDWDVEFDESKLERPAEGRPR